MKFRIACFLVLVTVLGCNRQPDAVPKPRAFPKVEYPERTLTQFSDSDCPFTFSYPDYMEIDKDKSFFGETPIHPCWFDLSVPSLNARIHCSYYEVNDKKSFNELVADAFRIANKINQRSNYMDEIRVGNQQGTGGLILEFQGPAASPMHFFLSDTLNHFFKASLYYNTKVQPDSLAPITEFIKSDIAGMINSFEWQ